MPSANQLSSSSKYFEFVPSQGFKDLRTGKWSRDIDLLNFSKSASFEWMQKQQASELEYSHTQAEEVYEPMIDTCFRLFGGMIAESVLLYPQTPAALDIGCGSYKIRPPYVRSIARDRMNYVGLDPMNLLKEDRDYLFIQGLIEDLPRGLSSESHFDLFIFATSLDHIQNLQEAAASLKSVSSSEGRCVFMIGLHDPSIVGGRHAADYFKNILADPSPSRMLRRLLFGVPRFYYQLFQAMKIRRQKLTMNQPLDELHFHYFSLDTIAKSLQPFGKIESQILVPGTNVILVRTKINK